MYRLVEASTLECSRSQVKVCVNHVLTISEKIKIVSTRE